jgi:hypothetical protein
MVWLATVPACGGRSSVADSAGGASGVAGATGNAGAAGDASCRSAAPCGGDPSGHWDTGAAGAANANGTCVSPVLRAGDACHDLYYFPASSSPAGLIKVTLPSPRMTAVTHADWKLEPDQSYHIELALGGEGALELSPACLTAYGANPTCTELQSQLQQFVAAEPEISQLACSATPDGGCGCTWTFELLSADVGNWRTTGQVLSFDSSITETTAAFDFCAAGDSLTVTWVPGSQFLPSSALGLRTLSLKRAE